MKVRFTELWLPPEYMLQSFRSVKWRLYLLNRWWTEDAFSYWSGLVWSLPQVFLNLNKKDFLLCAFKLAWVLALSCCREGGIYDQWGGIYDQYILQDAVSHLPCCHAYNLFNVLAVLFFLPRGCPWKLRPSWWGTWWWWMPDLGSYALEGCPTLLLFPYRKAMSAKSYSAHCCLPQVFSFLFQESLIAFCFHLLPCNPRRTGGWSTLYLDMKYCVRSATFTNNILVLEEWEQSDPLILFREVVLSKERLKLEGIWGGLCMLGFWLVVLLCF